MGRSGASAGTIWGVRGMVCSVRNTPRAGGTIWRVRFTVWRARVLVTVMATGSW